MQISIDLRFPFAHGTADKGIVGTLRLKGDLLLIQFPVEGSPLRCAFRVAPLGPSFTSPIAEPGAGGPPLEPGATVLKHDALLGHFRILDSDLGIAMIGVEAQWQQSIPDNVFLL